MNINSLKCRLLGHDCTIHNKSNIIFYDQDGTLYRLIERKCNCCGFRTQEWRTSEKEDNDVEIKWKPF